MEAEASVVAVGKEVSFVIDVSIVSDTSMVVISTSDTVIELVILSKEHIGPQLHATTRSVFGLP